MKNFQAEAQALRAEMVARRRDLHQHPELAFEEVRTASLVAQELTALGLEVQTGVGKTGVIGLLEGQQEGPTVLVRCDMDALPIHEQNETPYASQTPQKMHACGHDGHTTIGLAVAKMLNQQRSQIKGRVKFIFQPAEEIGRGAAAMIQAGALLSPKPEVSLGLHLWNAMPLGHVAITPGPAMAGSATFEIQLKGKGGHGALPNEAVDPVVTAAHLVTALQTIVSRNVNPTDTAVISVTQILAGNTHNVIPDQALLVGTLRYFKNEVRATILERMNAIVMGIANALGCIATIKIDDLTPPLINDRGIAQHLKQLFSQLAPEHTYCDDVITMGAEDMAYFLEQAAGVYFFVGSANAEKGLNYAHHHPRFDFDEESLVIGAALLAAAVADYVLA